MSEVKILIVDDAKFIRDHVTRIVREHLPECEVGAAEDGAVARKMMMAARYDLILCDWEMPNMSGLEVLQWTRIQKGYHDVPFVMITSRGERDYVLKAIQAGVNDYLGKPFEDKVLVDKIKKYAGKRLEVSAESRRKAAQMLATGKSTSTQAKNPRKPKGLAQIRLGAGSFKCAIKDITLQKAEIVMKREDGVPNLLEQCVVDIEQSGGKSVAQMNGFVAGLSANERALDTTFLTIDVQYIDNDPEKLKVLTGFIGSLSR